MQFRSPLLGALRVLWAVLPLLTGSALAAGLDGRSNAVQTVSAAILWSGWGAALLATLVPAPVSLTVMRALIAAGAAVAAAAAIAETTAVSALGALGALAALALALAPETGIRFVNGAAYPNERRFPLRVPAPLLLLALPVTWAAAIGSPVAAALLLASREWFVGAIASAVAVPLAYVLARAMHGLARRWLVFVPAGLVVHDPMTLADPVLFPRTAVKFLGPAPPDSTATDLTQRALGMPLELQVYEPASLSVVHPGRRTTDAVTVSAILVTPTRPGAVLAEAARRQIGQAATPPPSTSASS